MNSDDWATLADRFVLIVCLVAIILYACGVIQ